MNILYIILGLIFILFLFNSVSEHYENIHTFSKIDSHIYLSSYKLANDEKTLKKYNIKNVLTIMPKCDDCSKMTKYDNIRYLQIDKQDIKTENLKNEFDKTYNFIDDAVNKKENVLIHCRAGKSRSPTILAAYLMKKYDVTSEEALEHLKQHRKIIKPNSGFRKQLDDYEEDLKKK
jgi:protein-tyrosine phosphatase